MEKGERAQEHPTANPFWKAFYEAFMIITGITLGATGVVLLKVPTE